MAGRRGPSPGHLSRMQERGSRAGYERSSDPRGGGEGLPHSHTAVLRAWSVHLFTAAGAVLGLLALAAIMRGEWRAALIWMAVAMAVDSADGTLARWAHVKQVLPHFDGALLDNMVDYLNYAVIPAFFLLAAGLLPAGWGLFGAAGIVLASGYQFCRTDAKTDDHYFTGFPSYWNVVVLYLLLLRFDAWLALAIVLFLCLMVFVPFRYVYPSRTRPFRALTLALSAAWGILCLVVMFQYPAPSTMLVWASLAYVPYYVGISVLARRREAVEA
jgi:phosphatidylcholine synthase